MLGRTIFDDNTGVARLLGLRDSAGVFITTGTVTYDIKDSSDVIVVSGTLTYAAGTITIDGESFTDGNYSDTVAHTVAWTVLAAVAPALVGEIDCHYLEITAAISGEQYYSRDEIYIRARKGGDS